MPVPIVAAVGDGLYNTVLVLHILAAVIGFGGIALAGLHAAQAGAGGRGAAGALDADWTIARQWAVWAVYAVFLLGILLVLLSDEAWTFSDLWINLAMGVYIVGLGAFHILLAPARRAWRDRRGDTATTTLVGTRLALGSAVLDVVLVVNLVLMIWKPT